MVQKPIGYDESPAFTGEKEELPPGGHICQIIKAVVEKTETGQRRMVLLFDIKEGSPFDGFYKRKLKWETEQYGGDVKWSGKYPQLMEGKGLPFFKGMISSIEKSNPGYTWDWDENTLKGKLFGGVFRKEEFEGREGKLCSVIKCFQIRSVEAIKKGIPDPEPKLLPGGKHDYMHIEADDKCPAKANAPLDFKEIEEGEDDIPF